MRTSNTAGRAGTLDEQLPTSPCYLMRPEPTAGLQWIASARPEWRRPDGKPAVDVIASAAGISWQNFFRLKKALTTPPANKTIARLVKTAAAAHRVARRTAHERLFWFFDPDDPDDVERLLSYLEDDAAEQVVVR